MLLKRFECENFLFSYLDLFLKKGYISYNEVMNIIDINFLLICILFLRLFKNGIFWGY